jgi:trehalose synthase
MSMGSQATTWQIVDTAPKSLRDYAPIVGEAVLAEIEGAAAPLRGARVAHVSATAHGGGVAEVLRTLVPLMRSAGLDAQWHVLSASPAYFAVTKRLHNALQGAHAELTPAMQATYLDTNAHIAAQFRGDFDFVVVHDPQPAPLRLLRAHDAGKWIWRCHIDLTHADPLCWQLVRPYVEAYDAAIFTMPDFVQPDLRIAQLAIIPPAIDPLSPKNVPQAAHEIAEAVVVAGVDPARSLLLQVSRFDPWKDPLGVIDVYRAVRAEVPGLQLVMLGGMADDDPEGLAYYRQTRTYARGDPDIHLLTNEGGSREVNAFQRHAAVILQKSVREGFALTVTEGLWKARPVVAGQVGGIPLQIEDGVSGFLVNSVEQCADRVLACLSEPALAARLGARGHETVRERFLCTANLLNYLRLFTRLSGGASRVAERRAVPGQA